MSIDKDTIRKVARLARIAVKEDEIDWLTQQVGGIIKWVEQLAEVDTDNVEPHANLMNIAPHLREDAVTDGNCTDKVLANAPESTQGFFVVPKVVE